MPRSAIGEPVAAKTRSSTAVRTYCSQSGTGTVTPLQMRAFRSIQLAHSLTAIASRAHRLFDGIE